MSQSQQEEQRLNEKQLELNFKEKRLDFDKEIKKVRIEQETTIKLKELENRQSQ